MKGTLVKTEQGWMISRCVGDGVAEVWEELLPLHPDDITDVEQHIEATKITHGVEANMEVEFEAVNIWERNIGDIKPYAKLINHSVESNEMIDQVPDVRKMVEDIEKLAKLCGSPDSSGFYDYKEGFVNGYFEGYNKAKENTYTDIINWIDKEILLNPYFKDSPRLKEGATIVKNRLIIKNEVHKRIIS